MSTLPRILVQYLSAFRRSLTDAIVQFAGEMALRKVETQSDDTTGARQGILTFAKDGVLILGQTPGLEAANIEAAPSYLGGTAERIAA